MAESVSSGLHATLFFGERGGFFKFKINADRATSTVAIIAGTVVTLGGIYAYYKYQSREQELRFREALNRGLGGENEDHEVEDIRRGSLHVLLHCFTDERFLEVLEEFKSGKMKKRLKEEFLNIGIKTEGLVAEIENIKEVEERATAIISKR